jgi:biopolymer transport protein ExbD
MKLKLIFLALATMAVTASVAVAAPQKGKPPTTGAGCKPVVSVILTGTVAVAPGATPVLPFSLKVTVKHSNNHGHAYAKATQPITVTVTTDTTIQRDGQTSLASLLLGDRITVHARACKADLAHGATPALTATKIDAHAAK